MAALTDFAENALIDHLFRGQPLTLPASWHIALFTAAPTEAGGGTEVTGGAYARVAVARSLAAWAGTQGAGTAVASTGTGGQTSNNGAITYAAPTANWGSIVAMAVMDAATAGNMWVYATLAQPKTVNAGDAAPAFNAGQFTVTLA